MWRKRLRSAIAVFVVLFAAVVGVSLRRGQTQRAVAPGPATHVDPNAQIQNTSGGIYERTHGGQTVVSIKFGSSFSYPDGRTRFSKGITAKLPNKNGRAVTIDAQDAVVTKPPDKDVGQAEFT